MSLLSRLFGSKKQDEPAVAPETYKDFSIFAEPIREGKNYRIAARITKDVGGAVKEHQLIRADTLGDLADATAASLAKAKQVIDEQGERIF